MRDSTNVYIDGELYELPHWKELPEFYANLRFMKFLKGRSSVLAIWSVRNVKNTDVGFQYIDRYSGKQRKTLPMFLSDVQELLLNEQFNLQMKGTWKWVKRGQNMAIQLVKEEV